MKDQDPKSNDKPKGYPPYPKSEDIYVKAKEDKSVDPEDFTDDKELTKANDSRPVNSRATGSDLDIPGAELDDAQEEVGSEDEENNFYSLGGEKDLDEKHPDDV